MGIKVRALPKFQYSYNGSPASGFKVYTYVPGTSTAKATYTDSTGTVENANPVILDSNGEASIWWDGEYKVVIKTDQDVTVYTQDNYGAGEDAVMTGNYNLVTDGGFENDANGDGLPDDWTVTLYNSSTSAGELDRSDQYEGAYSLKFVSTGDGGGYATSGFFAVQEGRAVSVNFALKSSVVDVRNVLQVLWYDKSQTLLSTTDAYDNSTTNPTSWTEQAVSATPPANARFAKIRAIGCHSSDATSGTTWFDNVQAVQYVGGASSGLDADTLDGQDGAYYLSLTNATDNLPFANKAAFRGAFVYMSANESTAHNTTETLSFDSESYDTDSIHDTSTSPSRLTVPDGITKARVSAMVLWDPNLTNAGPRHASINKNGSATYAGAVFGRINNASQTATEAIYLSTPVISVTSGDYFELSVLQQSTGAIDVVGGSHGTRLTIELIE